MASPRRLLGGSLGARPRAHHADGRSIGPPGRKDRDMTLLSATRGAVAGANGLAYADLVAETGPVAWWPLDSNLVDHIGGRDGVIGAGSAIHAGPLPKDSGGSFDCAGTNWISVGHALALKPAVGSVMVWFKPSALGDFRIVNCDETGTASNNFALTTLATGLISAYWQVSGVHTEISTTSAYYTSGQI